MVRGNGEDRLDQELLTSIIRRYEDVSFHVHRRLNALLRRSIGDEEITLDQYSALRYLRKHGRATTSELSDSFCVGKSTITSIMTRLFDKRLIERTPDDRDRRILYLSLTDKGRQLADVIDARIRERLSAVMNHFGRLEALQFIETFEKLAEVLMLEDGRSRSST